MFASTSKIDQKQFPYVRIGIIFNIIKTDENPMPEALNFTYSKVS